MQWEFTDLVPGGIYQVSATWAGTWNRATDAPFTMTDGVTSTMVDKDQGQAPNDFEDEGAWWEILRTFTLDAASSTLTVRLSDDANAYVIADAIRIEDASGPEIEVEVDGGQLETAVSVVDFGIVLQNAAAPTKTFTVRNTGNSALTLSNPTIASGSGFGVSTLGQTTLPASGTTTFTMTQDTTTIGTFTATVSMGNNDGDESPFEFTVTGEVSGGPPAGATIVDDGDAGFHVASGAWGSGGGSQFFQSDHRYHAPGSGSSVVEWEFSGLVPGAMYQVAATWAGTWNRATDAPFTVTDGVTSLTVDKDQGQAPDDFTDQGSSWEFLTDLTLDAGSSTLTVRLSDDANGYVIADAVRIEGVTGPEIEVEVDGGPVQDGQSTVDFGAAPLGGPEPTKTVTVRNAGTSDLTLSQPTIAGGSGFSVSTLGQTTLAAGASTTFTVTQATSNSGSFTATVSIGNDDSDENPFTFTVTGEVAGSNIVDNEDAGFRIVSGAWGFNGSHPDFFQSDHRYHAPGSGSSVVEWEFSGLVPGGTYQVSATWAGTWNRANDAPFTISDGVGSQTVDKDQGDAPNDYNDQGAWWEFLADFTVDAGSSTLTVQLSDDADGYVIADAVRIVLVASPLRAAGGTGSATNAVTVDQGAVESLLDASITQWAVSGLDASSVERLRQVDVVVTDLPGPTLGLASGTDTTIWLDDDGAGYGWYADSTPFSNEEYKLSADGVLSAVAGSDAFGRMDLLTVLSHELGHVIGLEDLDADTYDLMAETLATGIRRAPSSAGLAFPLNPPKTDDSPFAVTQDSTATSVSGLAPDQPTRGRPVEAGPQREARNVIFAQLADLAEDESDELFDVLYDLFD